MSDHPHDPEQTDQPQPTQDPGVLQHDPEQNAPTPAPEPSPEDAQALRDQRFRNSRGAQVILDPMSDASLAARGGAGGTIEENELVRQQAMLAHGLHPFDPDASHLPGNTVPAGGEIMDQVSDEHEPAYVPPAKED